MGEGMELGTAHALCALNNEFYRRQSESFSATREASWPGWERVLASMLCGNARSSVSGVPYGDAIPHVSGAPFGGMESASSGASCASQLRVLDVACGNLRFERFLAAKHEGAFYALGVDSCDAMALSALEGRDFGEGSVDYLHVDVVGRLLEDDRRDGIFGLSACEKDRAAFDAVVSFGFMHHIPGKRNRLALLRELVEAVRPGGIVAVSLWRFMDDERLARKARAITERVRERAVLMGEEAAPKDEEADADPSGTMMPRLDPSEFECGDYLLGWKDDSNALRYCHHFDDAEISSLISCVSGAAMLLDRFSADGKSGSLNEYLVFRRL